MKNIMMAAMLSVVGAQVCASEHVTTYVLTDKYVDSTCTLSLENTKEGYKYRIKTNNGVLLLSESSLSSILEKRIPTYEQLAGVIPQQDKLIDRLSRVAVEAQGTASEAVKQLVESHAFNNRFALVTRRQMLQLKLQKLAISALTLINAGLVGYYWYQQWYGTQQNCPLQ
jgi:hypothetical protein